MKKFLLSLAAVCSLYSANAQIIEKVNYLGALDKDPKKDWTKTWTNWDPKNATYGAVTDSTTLNDASGEKLITGTLTLSSSQVYLLKTILVIKSGGKLVVPAGTVVRGRANTGTTPKEYATVVVERGGKIEIQGTQANPVVFTSAKPIGSRDRGDWGGIFIAGNAPNNQGASIQMEGFNNVSFDNQLAFHGGTVENDNSGSLTYLRIEFGGFAFEPNKELNGITFASVGSATKVDNIQVSYSGDDSYEWFGGSVNCKHIIAYKGTDDDFDTDFGYRGSVQFGIAQKDTSYYDLSWNVAGGSTSECFESDNDASGSGKLPLTSAVFTNMTCVGPVPVGGKWSDLSTTIKGAYRRGARIRRNSRISITNSIFMGYRNFVMLDGDSTLYAAGARPTVNPSNDYDLIRNNYFCNSTVALTPATTTANGLSETSTGYFADSVSKWLQNAKCKNLIDKVSYTSGTVLIDPQNKTNPNFRPVSTNSDLYNTSDYTNNIYPKYGTFVVCDSITRQPKSLAVKTSENAEFNFAYSTEDATFQWQSNTGSGFKNISNIGQFAGTSNDSMTVSNVTMANNGAKFRCVVSTRWCKDSTSSALLTAIFKACTIITSQPTSASKASGSDAIFTVATNDNTATIKWESDFDLGMQVVPATSKYVNVNTTSLTVKNIALRNNGQTFRAIAQTNVCADTSKIAMLNITDSCISYKSVKVTDTLVMKVNVSVSGVNKSTNIKVYPVPTKNELTIDNGNFTLMGGYSIKIYSMSGALVYAQTISQQQYTVDLANWTGLGVYSMQVLDNNGAVIGTKKIILE